MPASTAASSVARASSSLRVPYQPTRPMQPKPMAETEVLLRPTGTRGRRLLMGGKGIMRRGTAGKGKDDDHRLSRTLHHRAAIAHRLPRRAEGRAEGSRPDTLARVAEDQRRPDPRQPGKGAAEAAARARLGPDRLLAARLHHGAPHRQR